MISKSLGVVAIVICIGCVCFALWAAGPRIIHGINVLISPELQTPSDVEPIDQEAVWRAVNGQPARDM